METGVQQKVSTTNPLGSLSPRRVSTSDISSRSPDQKEDQKLETEIRRQENQVLQKLRARDREVRAHEAAHLSAGRAYVTGGPNYTYQRGPDGRSYAIGGEVQLDTSEEADPEATLTKADTVKRAALAPANPSPQDLRVAANATQMAAQARLEIAILRREQDLAENRSESNNVLVESNTAVEQNSNAIQSFAPEEPTSTGFSQFA